jgi:hypothetical protein
MTMTSDLVSTASTPAAQDRRRSPRQRPTSVVPLGVGRGYGSLVDLSATGARVRHDAPAALGAPLRIRYEWRGGRFDGSGVVLASRVISLGDGSRTRYESRLHFLSLTQHARSVLAQTLADLEEHNLRKWVANLRGWGAEPPEDPPADGARTFIRCRHVAGRWEQRATRDPSLPDQGFIVPSSTDPFELRLLCRTYASGADGRDLVRLLSRAVVWQ